MPIIIRFWEADDEFPASLQILADRNTLDYMHYETLMFALTHLFSRLKEEMRIEKGEESRQRLIECAAELFWKNGYSATGISEILKQTDLPKGSFYFYFKSKDDLATAVTEYYQKSYWNNFKIVLREMTGKVLLKKSLIFYLKGQMDKHLQAARMQ